MTIASQTSRITYTGDGVTTAFAVPFYFQANSDIVVYLQNTTGSATLQIFGTNYGLTGATLSAGGTCTFVTAPASGYLISIYRDPPMTQTTSYNNNDPFPAKSHELALDKTATIDQRTRDLVSRSLHLTDGEASTVTTLASIATRKNKLLGFDLNGAIIYSTGPTFINSTATASAIIDSRATASVTTFPLSVSTLRTNGYATAGDGGEAIYTRGVGTSVGAFQDGSGVWWNLVISSEINLRALGAGQGSGAADVAAMTAASTAQGTVEIGHVTGIAIRIPAGNYDFSTGQFLFTIDGTRIIGDGIQTTIKFNPASPAALFTFFRSGDALGILNCELSNCRIWSDNTVKKTIVTLSNTSDFKLLNNVMFGITDAGGLSVAILYEGRNWLTHEDNFITADTPFFFATNPDRALAGFEDADFTTGARNQYATNQTNGAIYRLQDGLNITNWTAKNEDWAGGLRGVDCVDSLSTGNSSIWTFENIRREQVTGGSPAMFVIVRSGVGKLRDLRVISPSVSNGQLANLSGIDRASFVKPFFNTDGTLILTADSTVANLNWTGMFASAGNTIALAGQTLIRGRERMGGTTAAPIYMDATYTNVAQGAIEWIGAPSAVGRRMGLWRGVADVPVSTGVNDFALLPWTLYTVLYAEIKVSSQTISGIATFRSGQVAPGGCTSLVGQTNFAVDGGAGHLSVFHYSDVNVAIVNKLAGSAPVTVEVLFTI